MKKELTNAIFAADDKAQYDERAIFYVCRLVSSQKERDFVNMNYDDIKNVFSIWICMNMKENSMTCYSLSENRILVTEKLNILENEYDIMLEDEVRKDVNVMCNLGEGIEERVREEVTEEVTEKVTENALSKYIARSKKRNISKSETIVDIMEDYELDEDEATKKVEMYWE